MALGSLRGVWGVLGGVGCGGRKAGGGGSLTALLLLLDVEGSGLMGAAGEGAWARRSTLTAFETVEEEDGGGGSGASHLTALRTRRVDQARTKSEIACRGMRGTSQDVLRPAEGTQREEGTHEQDVEQVDEDGHEHPDDEPERLERRGSVARRHSQACC